MIARYQRFLELKAQYPQKHARELAALMGIAEAELVAARVGHQAQPLRPQMRELLHALEAVGKPNALPVMSMPFMSIWASSAMFVLMNTRGWCLTRALLTCAC